MRQRFHANEKGTGLHEVGSDLAIRISSLGNTAHRKIPCNRQAPHGSFPGQCAAAKRLPSQGKPTKSPPSQGKTAERKKSKRKPAPRHQPNRDASKADRGN